MTKCFVFAPLSEENPTFNDVYKGIITKITSYSVTRNATAVGSFTLVTPCPLSIKANIQYDDILWLQDGHKEYWLIVRNFEYSTASNSLTITGTDLKGLLGNRVTLYPSEAQDVGAFGYDVCQGTTEDCCIHYVNSNAVNAEDSNRNIYGLVCSHSGGTVGITDDTYRSRFESLPDVIAKLCDIAKVVWDIVGDVENNRYVFAVKSGVNRSETQSNRSQVIFRQRHKNISELKRAISNVELKNVIYATKSGGTLESDAYTATVYRDDVIPKGIYRKEIQLNVSCDRFEDVDRYALHDAVDYISTDCITVEAAFPEDYGKKYDVGDIVTAVDEWGNAKLTDAITSVTVTGSKTDYKVQLTIGYSEPKPVKKIINKINKGAI